MKKLPVVLFLAVMMFFTNACAGSPVNTEAPETATSTAELVVETETPAEEPSTEPPESPTPTEAEPSEETSSEDIFIEETEPLPPLNIELIAGSGVTKEEQDIVIEELTKIAAYIDNLTGYRINSFKLFLFWDREEIANRYMNFLGIPASEKSNVIEDWVSHRGKAGADWMFILLDENTRPESINVSIYKPYKKVTGMLVHEYTHLIQHTYANSSIKNSPAWFTEGMASYIDGVYTMDLEHREKACYPDCLIDPFDGWVSTKKFKGINAPVSLKEIEQDSRIRSLENMSEAYALGFWAVHQLRERSSIQDLFDYYKIIGKTHSWEASFQQAFGITSNEFYKEFENLRSQI